MKTGFKTGITTRIGDKGKTALLCGEKVSKDHIRVDACGILDELCSFLGVAKSLINKGKVKTLIEAIQKDLFVLGAEFSCNVKFIKKLKKRIDTNYVKRLEYSIRDIEKEIKLEGRCFVLPGENLISSTLDVARTIARRLERKAVTLKNKDILKNTQILAYLNRLSDLLYLLARSFERKHKK